MSNNRQTRARPPGDILWQHHLILNLDKRQFEKSRFCGRAVQSMKPVLEHQR